MIKIPFISPYALLQRDSGIKGLLRFNGTSLSNELGRYVIRNCHVKIYEKAFEDIRTMVQDPYMKNPTCGGKFSVAS